MRFKSWGKAMVIVSFCDKNSCTHWEKNAIESIAFLSKSMYITDSNQYAIELVTYLLVLVVYFYEFIVYMLLERNAFDSIAFFSQCRNKTSMNWSFKKKTKIKVVKVSGTRIN